MWFNQRLDDAIKAAETRKLENNDQDPTQSELSMFILVFFFF